MQKFKSLIKHLINKTSEIKHKLHVTYREKNDNCSQLTKIVKAN